MGQADCKVEFRIEKADLHPLTDVLQTPERDQMQRKEPLGWPRRAVPATEAGKLPLSIQRYNSSISACPVSFLSLITNEV